MHIIHSGNQEQIKKVKFVNASADFLLHYLVLTIQQQQQQHSLFSQASWGRLEMKPERNKFKVQAH